MPRIRTVKPETWEDETFAALSPMARLLFIASWNFADDEGIVRWTPDYIKASVFMYDDLTLRKVKGLMAELEAADRVQVYEADRKVLAFIPTFHKHQRISHPQPSQFPSPPSGTLFDSLNGSGNQSGNQSETESPSRARARSIPFPSRAVALKKEEQEFEAFWEPYPRKEGKGQARKAFAAARAKTDLAVLVAAAERYAADPNREPAYTAHASTWLNGDRWLDAPLPPRNGSGPPARMATTIASVQRFLGDEHDQDRTGGSPRAVGRGLPGSDR